MFKPRDSKIWDFICRLNYIVEYIKHFTPFGKDQKFPEDKNIRLVKFSLTRGCKSKLLVQGFELAAKSLKKLVDFCERLKTSKEIFHDKGDVSQPNKNPNIPLIYTNQPIWLRTKGQTIPLTSKKRMQKLNLKIKLIILPVPCAALDMTQTRVRSCISRPII